MTLNASAENGSSSEDLRSPIGLPSASTVLMASTSAGAGQVVDDRIQHLLHALVLVGRAAQHRIEFRT